MKRNIVLLIFITVAGFCAVFLAFRGGAIQEPDIVAANDIVITALNSENQAEAVDMVTGYLLRNAEEMDTFRKNRDARLQVALYTMIGLFALSGGLLLWSIHRSILAPFHRLEHFARRIAAGDLDIPLHMDRAGSFGAFTESFDLMRTELARAREAERQATQSKKELVASLSHDIKTPVASIKAVAELMSVTAAEEKDGQRLEIIRAKADQIDLLISNMFTATLEELQELPVTPTELPSTQLAEIIHNADYQQKAAAFTLPECLLIGDAVRLAQVMDNIFINSYKYADTGIELAARLEGHSLHISISDCGKGVLPEELPLLTQKFYRGENTAGQSGAGLGLYVSKYFMEKMSGELHCQNSPGGFSVLLTLTLA